jgi:glycosyltransferase involved in cell wall biosynthesis
MHVALTADPELPVPPRLYGGIERIVDMLVHGLVERGHEVTLFAHPDSDVPCRLIPYGGSGQHPLNILRNTASVSRLAFARPDVVHSFGRLAYLTAVLPTRIPTIMSYQRKPSLDRVQLAAQVARSGSLVFTGCSEHIAAQIRPHAPAFPVFNGVPLETYDFQPDVADDAPLVFLGRLAPIKGVHAAIAVAQQTGRRLVLAGNVPATHQTYFDEQIQPHLDGERIRYVGPVDDTEKNDLLGRAAALLMPIEWEEPFGIVMAEALACGTPVIGTRRGAVPEVVDDGVTGFVCDTTEEMAAAVEQIDDIDRAACRKRCERLFSSEAIIDAYEQLYEQHASGALS